MNARQGDHPRRLPQAAGAALLVVLAVLPLALVLPDQSPVKEK